MVRAMAMAMATEKNKRLESQKSMHNWRNIFLGL